MAPTDPPDPVPMELTSKTICSGGRGPCRAAGQKQPAPGWPRAGLQGRAGREAWLAFPLQLPARLGSRGARLSAQTLPDRGPKTAGRGGPHDLRGWSPSDVPDTLWPSWCHPEL